jgi:hypothetical protein
MQQLVRSLAVDNERLREVTVTHRSSSQVLCSRLCPGGGSTDSGLLFLLGCVCAGDAGSTGSLRGAVQGKRRA